MTEHNKSLEARLDDLAGQVHQLTGRVSDLSGQVAALEEKRSYPETNLSASRSEVSTPAQESVLASAEKASLLPRISTICFLLVVALMLRTVTDNKIIDPKLGSYIGMAYAIALVLAGCYLYSRKNRLACVFPGCGMLLLFFIVLETHSRFHTLSTPMANAVLLVAMFSAACLGIRYRASTLLNVGTLGAGLTAIAINFPYPIFPFVGGILLLGNLAAHVAHGRQICLSLRWSSLVLTVFFWVLWTVQLGGPTVSDASGTGEIYLAWFLPLLFLFWAFYSYTSVRRVLSSDSPLGIYHGILPTLCATGVFLASRAVLVNHYSQEDWLGVVAVLVALIHFGGAGTLFSLKRGNVRGLNIFIFPGVVLLALALPTLLGSFLWSLPLWSATGLGLAVLSVRWKNHGVRLTSYFLQAFTCLAGVVSGAIWTLDAAPSAGIFVAGMMAVMSVLQYRWCRAHEPRASDSAYFSWFDTRDRSALVLLLIAVVSAFCMLRLGLHTSLLFMIDGIDNAFSGGQSVLINLAALILMLLGLRWRKSEILAVAVAVAFLGAFKVFLLDMFSVKGIPLVLSVFSFGFVAAIGSVVSGRWQKTRHEDKEISQAT